MKKLKGFSCFSGIGGFDLPMQELGIEIVGHSDIDKFADQTYSKNFPGIKNFGDISKIVIQDLPDFDILTGGFPCQDVSVAGKQDLSNGRTVLVEYLLRMLEIKKPKYFIFENVKGLTSIKFKTFFDSICQRMSEAGYSYKFKVLNTRNFGIPQNRERIYFVGKLEEKFELNFPEGKKLEIFLDDILEKEVAEKYFLSNEQYEKLKAYESNARIYEKICCTLNTMQGGHRQPKIFCHSLYPRTGGKVSGGTGHLFKKDGTAYCLDTGNMQGIEDEEIGFIRKLTPVECERLQGFPDNWTAGVSDSQRYKQLGNAVSVPVVKAVLSNLIFSDIENVEPLDL